jgi:hypothetical protein
LGVGRPTLLNHLKRRSLVVAYAIAPSLENPRSNLAWTQYNLTWSLAGAAVPASRQIEIKLVATGGTRDVEIAYDTTAYPSALTLP